MRKLYGSILAVLLPSILYLAVFFLQDPHGYFAEHSENNGELVDNMLAWRNGDYDAILLGDSRMVGFDETYIGRLDDSSGHRYRNMAYGGCMAEEMNELFYWCNEVRPGELKSVIIVSGWYNFGTMLQQNRVASTEKIIENPLSYGYSIDNMRDLLAGIGVGAEQTENQKAVTAGQKEENMRLHLASMMVYLDGFEFDQNQLDALIEICQYCTENQIDIKFVCPPSWEDYYVQLDALGLLSEMDDYKEQISEYMDVYDMEYPGCELGHRYDDFTDYSHFHNGTYGDVADVVIDNSLAYARLWKNGTVVKE